MIISFNRIPRVTSWGGGNQFLLDMIACLRKAGHTVVFTLTADVDVIFMLDPRPEEGGYSAKDIYEHKLRFPRVKVIHRINECDARKGTNFIDAMLVVANVLADETIFISSWLKTYFETKGLTRPSHVIYNGCNLQTFYPEIREIVHSPLRIVTHHWSDNDMKGADFYKIIDQIAYNEPKKFQFTYIGRHPKSYVPIATRLVKPLSGVELGAELRQHDVYVTASRWEPCGMHHIEASASGLPVLYHRDGGGIVEGCKKHNSVEFYDTSTLKNGLENIAKYYKKFRNDINRNFLCAEKKCYEYKKIIEDLS